MAFAHTARTHAIRPAHSSERGPGCGNAADGNVLDACFDSDTYRDSPTAERIFHPDCAPVGGGVPGFADFVFWDDIHPTGAVHAAIGAALIELLPLN